MLPQLGPAYRSAPSLPRPDHRDPTLVEVVVSWGAAGPLAVAHLRAGERFVLSSHGRTDPDAHAFVHPAIEGPAHLLVEVDRLGRACTVRPPAGATATVERPAAVDVVAGSFALRFDERAHVEHGEVHYRVRHVPAAERLPARRDDRLFGAATALVLACTVAAGTWVRGVDRDDLLDQDGDAARAVMFARGPVLRARVYAPTHPEPDVGVEGGTGLRAAGDEGAAGSPLAPPVSRRWTTPPHRGPAREATAVRDAASARERVLGRGVFAAMGAGTDVSWRSVVPGDVAERGASGAMYGAAVGDAAGYAGIGLIGLGWGGGRGDGLVGLGRVRTRGHGTDDGSAQGMGHGNASGCGERTDGGCEATVGRLRVRASNPIRCGCGIAAEAGPIVDPASIRRVVLRNLGQVRRCYETALADAPNARGRVGVRWVVGGDGAVLAAAVTDNDTGSAALGECVATAVRRWTFPAAAAGTVNVNYPFDFTLADP
jgi:hypothetical protein